MSDIRQLRHDTMLNEIGHVAILEIHIRWRAMSNLGSSVLIANAFERNLDRSASPPAARSPVIQGFLNEQVSVVGTSN